jgi:hypothetical protein
MTLHNAVQTAESHITALMQHTTGLWELIVVLDACTDGTAVVMSHALKQSVNQPGHPIRIQMLASEREAWETASDNAGMRATHPSTRFIVLVQADVEVYENGWNEWLALPLLLFDDLFAVSARCAHNYLYAYTACHRAWFRRVFKRICRRMRPTPSVLALDPALECTHHPTVKRSDAELDAERKLVVIRDTVNRGPLMYRAERVRMLNLLDEAHFRVDHDEHELNLRAYLTYGWKTGRFPVGFLHKPLHRSADAVKRRPQNNVTGLEALKQRLSHAACWNENRQLAASVRTKYKQAIYSAA